MRIFQVGTNRRSGKTVETRSRHRLAADGARGADRRRRRRRSGSGRRRPARHLVDEGLRQPDADRSALHLHLLDPERDRRSAGHAHDRQLSSTPSTPPAATSARATSSARCGSSSAFAPGFATPPTCTGGPRASAATAPREPVGGASRAPSPSARASASLPFSFYTVKAADFNLPGHALPDAVTVGWHDLCNGPRSRTPRTRRQLRVAATATPTRRLNGAASQAIVTQLPSTTATTIHNAAHAPVTAVAAGSIVHDSVTVSGGAGSPVPTGTVTIDWFTNNTCTGAPVTTSAAADARQRHGRRDRLPAGPAGGRSVRLQGALPR